MCRRAAIPFAIGVVLAEELGAGFESVLKSKVELAMESALESMLE